MPIIGSTSGSYGFGRSPQTPPPVGFTYYSPSQDPKLPTPVHYFDQLGSFILDAEQSGKSFVITPTASFYVYVKIWGAGGGSGNTNISTFHIGHNDIGTIVFGEGSRWGTYSKPADWTNSALTPYKEPGSTIGGSGGFVQGRVLLQAQTPYTIFVGAAGSQTIPGRQGLSFTTAVSAAGGGAASGILFGNIFSTTSTLSPLAVAGGGGGAFLPRLDTFYLAGAGGGKDGGLSTRFQTLAYTSSTNGTSRGVIPTSITSGSSGLPLISGSVQYSGGIGSDARPPLTTPLLYGGGGGGGDKGGNWSSGGAGNVLVAEGIDLTTDAGKYSITPGYDSSIRGTAGDPSSNGRLVMFLNEYSDSKIVATGGTVTTVPIPGHELAYKYHTFTESNTSFQVTSVSGNMNFIDVFTVGGGGGCLVANQPATPQDAKQAAGGGGGVAFRSRLPISVGTYNVFVGKGGMSETFTEPITTSMYLTPTAMSGEPSAFFSNSLAGAKFGFPDNYFVLIHSFGAAIRYININGTNTDGLTIETGYTSFNSALSRNLYVDELIVFVVLPGTYNESVSAVPVEVALGGVAGRLTTPINDQNQPRIFVCSPGKVTIQWNVAPSTATVSNASPMCQLMHPRSAVYGAIFDRIGYTKDSVRGPDFLEDLAFFGHTKTGFTQRYTDVTQALGGNQYPAIPRGKLVNCVFRDMTGDWGLFGNTKLDQIELQLHYCTFVTKNADIALTGVGTPRTYKHIVLNKCIFSKSMTFSKVEHPSVDYYLENVKILSKYVAENADSYGVYFGPYAWNSFATVPAKGTTEVAIVGQGGGGGTFKVFDGFADRSLLSYTQLSSGYGCGGGSLEIGSRNPSTQKNIQSPADYSCFGQPGAILTNGANSGSILENNAGGGGAGYPGKGVYGGVGVEFPTNSGIYYGTGGSVKMAGHIVTTSPFNLTVGVNTVDVPVDVPTNELLKGDVGLGGGTNNVRSLTPNNGNSGIVIVRYVVPGPYTDTVPTIVQKNIVAFGGNYTFSGETYREHVFLNNGIFEIAELPAGGYIDVLLVGGGGSGAYRAYYGSSSFRQTGGSGGEVVYKRIYLNEVKTISISIGTGAPANSTHDVFNSRSGQQGSRTTFGADIFANGGAGGIFGVGPTMPINGTPGILITDGLFSDNTIKYGSGGAGFTKSTSPSILLSGTTDNTGGGAVTSPGVNNTGGGGGSSDAEYRTMGGGGGSGIVRIRYPITRFKS